MCLYPKVYYEMREIVGLNYSTAEQRLKRARELAEKRETKHVRTIQEEDQGCLGD